MDEAGWQQLAAGQDRVLTRRQALTSELDAATWDRRLATSRWQRLLPGVAASHDGATTAAEHWAAVHYAGPGALLSGDGALAVHGMSLPEPAAYDAVIPGHRQVLSQTRSPVRSGCTAPSEWPTSGTAPAPFPSYA